MCKNCPDKFCLLRKFEDLHSPSIHRQAPPLLQLRPTTLQARFSQLRTCYYRMLDNCIVFMPPISIASALHACFVASTLHPSFKIQASKFVRIKPETNLHAGFVASTSHRSFRIQASNFDSIKPPLWLHHIHSSESKLQISIASNLHTSFVT